MFKPLGLSNVNLNQYGMAIGVLNLIKLGFLKVVFSDGVSN